MTQNQFVAHRRKTDGEIQSVMDHLFEVSQLSRHFAQKLGVPDLGELLGLLHDFGKYSQDFQSYIQSATDLLNPDIDDDYVDSRSLKGKIDHSSAGAQWIWERFRLYNANRFPIGKHAGQIMALCLASHHGGMIDCLRPDGKVSFLDRIAKSDDRTHLQECLRVADKEVIKNLTEIATTERLQDCLNFFQKLEAQNLSATTRAFQLGLWTRFLFSCLIDADRIDSADFETPSRKAARNMDDIDWTPAITRLENYLENLAIRNEIDIIRRQISQECLSRACDPQGLYKLTVPTGGGKTYASIRFALHHAQKHNLDHIIYIIPYTSIIDQNAADIRKILEKKGDAFSWVLEQHSNLEPEKQTWQSKLVAENWDAPIIFTTMVQFLEALFGGGTRGARRMHQLAKSVLIFDEIQTLPIKCFHMFCNSLNFLVAHTQTTAILCTATQPVLDRLRDPEKGQLVMAPNSELIGNVADRFEQLNRVKISNKYRPQGWNEEELTNLAIDEYNNKGNCLFIVNTKQWAQQLFHSCKEYVDRRCLFHLSTSLCPAHRKLKLKKIKRHLHWKLPVMCISTQLIEAGVDVDFNSVIRFLAGLDSIAQAAGRCNRNGRGPQATVHVVNPDQENIEMLHDIMEGRDKALRIFSESSDDLLAPDVMERYFEYYFYSRADEMVYPVNPKQAGRTDSLLNLLAENRGNIAVTDLLLKQSFMTAGNIFQVIDAPTQAVIVPYKKGKEIIGKLCAAFDPAKDYALLSKAQQYSVNVFPNVWKKLNDCNAVSPIQPGLDIYALNERYYSDDFGLSTEAVSTLSTLIG
ncbi:MAG: CRISPR-associated protein [Desulfobulbaceae bacterium BRH_c16a]|nr:MAG: CRISPR-associated protein [Desulfobulbaceae bacterium BRH_c16a]